MSGIYTTQPKVHRSNITAVDAADPADTSGAVDTKGYRECRFDITVTGTIVGPWAVAIMLTSRIPVSPI